MGHTQLPEPVRATKNLRSRSPKLTHVFLLSSARLPNQHTYRNTLLVNINSRATRMLYFHLPTSCVLAATEGTPICDSLSYALSIQRGGYSSLFRTASGLN